MYIMRMLPQNNAFQWLWVGVLSRVYSVDFRWWIILCMCCTTCQHAPGHSVRQLAVHTVRISIGWTETATKAESQNNISSTVIDFNLSDVWQQLRKIPKFSIICRCHAVCIQFIGHTMPLNASNNHAGIPMIANTAVPSLAWIFFKMYS